MNKRKHSWRIPPEEVTEYHVENGRAPHLSDEERVRLFEARSQAQKARWAKPGAREAQSQRNAAQWADPVYRAKQSTRLKEQAQRLVKASTAKWQDPEYRARQSEIHRNAWTPERRDDQSKRSKKALDNPATKAKLRAASTERWADPEQRQRIIDAHRAAISTPEYKAHQKESANTPERRAKSAEAARNQWASYTPEEKQAKMARLHSTVKGGHKLSALEAQVVMILNRLGLWYRLHEAVGNYVADILVQGNPMIDIECDGVYWHKDKPSDAERDLWFAENGYNVVRVRDDDVDTLKERLS
jgi:very-short-patch-repair endonuclease